MIERLNSRVSAVEQSAQKTHAAPQGQGTFGDLLRQRIETVGTSEGGSVALSKHAQMRVEERGIEVTGDVMARLNDSVMRAQAKGAKNILVFDATRAFIVDVSQNRVITAISQDEMKDNVFTNIDGAVLL